MFIYFIYFFNLVLFNNQDGVKETGVSVAYTVRALDAGPVIAHEKFEVDDQIKVGYLFTFS